MPIRPCLSLAMVVAVAGCSAPSSEADSVQVNTAGATPEDQQREASTDISPPSEGDEITADTPITSDNYAKAMEARSRDYARLEYKLVTLNGVTSGDNVYLDLTRRVEGAAQETVLCTAPACANWRDVGGLPKVLRGKAVTAKFGTANQVDGSGAIMARGVPAVVDLRVPATKPSPAPLKSAELPLTPNVYVLEDSPCENPANAAFRIWNGRGLSGSATKDCRSTILSREGETYTIRNDCVNTYDGSRTPETLTIRVPDQVHFTLKGNRFRSCSMAQVPAALRKLVR